MRLAVGKTLGAQPVPFMRKSSHLVTLTPVSQVGRIYSSPLDARANIPLSDLAKIRNAFYRMIQAVRAIGEYQPTNGR